LAKFQVEQPRARKINRPWTVWRRGLDNRAVNMETRSMPAPADTLGEQILQRVDELSQYSQSLPGLTRCYLTPEHKLANTLVAGWMRDAGMDVTVDGAGNVIGRINAQAPDAPCLMLGSHLDSVRNAGIYDGNLGVVLPISCIAALRETGTPLPCNLEVIGFGDEEGVRFGATLIGSRAVAGTLDDNILEATDADGITLAQALTDFDLDPVRIDSAARKSEDLHGYVEVHIEQGPVLEDESLAVGIVTAIAGASRYKVDVRGVAGHAGTVPMNLRADALPGAAEMALAVEKMALANDNLVGTCGIFEVPAGAVNVIPGGTSFTMDVRSGNDDLRKRAVRELHDEFRAIAERRGLSVEFELLHDNGASQCNAPLSEQLARAVAATGVKPRHLPSGAGHDAMAMADITPAAMLFVRCTKGISHHPDEHMTVADADSAAQVMMNFLTNYIPE
jgi:allantoate deiminase